MIAVTQCTEPDCTNRHAGRGFCKKHLQQKRRAGVLPPADPNWRKLPKGQKAYHGDGVSITSSGYRRIRRGPNDWVLEHRLVMEQKLGRQLVDGENVHHKNGDKLDNSPDNLELWVTHQPAGQRVEDALAWAHEIISRYEGNL